MPKSISKKKKQKKKAQHHPEARGLVYIASSILLFLCLVSFVDGQYEENWLGLVGHFVAHCLHYLFGLGNFLIVSFLLWMGWRLIRTRDYKGVPTKFFYFSLFLFSSCILLNLLAETKWVDISAFHEKVYSQTAIIYTPTPVRYVRYNLGGVPLYFLYRDLPTFNLQNLFSDFGVCLTFSIIALVSFILLTDASFFRSIKALGRVLPYTYDFTVGGLRKIVHGLQTLLPRKPMQPDAIEASNSSAATHLPPYRTDLPFKRTHIEPFEDLNIEEEHEEEEIVEEEPSENSEPNIQIAQIDMKPSATNKMALDRFLGKKKHSNKKYTIPPLSLLTDAKKVDQTGLKIELKKRAKILEETLMSFGIEAKVGQIYSGPTVTLFEVLPAIGVKVQKITALENDIALNMQAKSMRIIAPIPGKAAVGVEIPSLFPQEVGFKEMLNTYRRTQHHFHIPMLLGKTVSGEEVMCDLTKMPHCIIAGATGSGKSVCINTILMSILMNLGPDEVKLILIDPKKVELTPFANLPHLIAPVITEPAGAYSALQWIVREMQYRYELFKRMRVRNIVSFNSRKIDKGFEETLEMPVPEKLHFIVCIIDEFADLMMTSNADIETPIARIAQMARAVGIHLILATQRPSREVITGLIKANFPTRISFKVSSRINSQIILDETGAESLLGNGDMLFLPPGSSQLTRCQGVFVRDEDISKVVEFITSRMPTNYLFESFDNGSADEMLSDGDNEPKDPLYAKALQIVLNHRTASTTFLQRKLKIGYARAASLMDELEQNGIIGPPEGSRPRKILRDIE